MRGEPGATVTIVFDTDQAARADLLHRVRNYGEDVWRALRHEKRAMLTLQEIDRAIDRFSFACTTPIIAKRAAKTLGDMLPEHMLIASITID